MPELTSQEKLFPSLLDRLTDNQPTSKSDSKDNRYFTVDKLRDAVLRDLSWLLSNAHLESTEDFGILPEIPSSVINYGIPDLTGKTVSGVLSTKLEDSIKQSIRWFEPRLIPDTIEVVVHRTSGEHARPNAIAIEIRADLWCQPIPEKLYVSTVVDLESGIIDVVDQS
ncbi:MAG: type VI secretion system baseplate subunit TssE [Pirellula sp.]|jgi:type VI secretion system protein ImpF|nr:type VI secretion system baseplate subunit TssE [Pirellula sp.]